MDDMLSLGVGTALAFGTPAYLVLQVAAIATARAEGWRVAALLPLLFSAPIAVWCLFALAQDANLWPVPFVLFAPLGALYLLGYFGLRAARA